MKFNDNKKRFLFFLFFCTYTSLTSFAQTILTPGDIAVFAFKTNNGTDSGDDGIKLVTLVDLACTTTFVVTDNNWNGSAWACNDDESGMSITCNVPIAAGSVFYINYDGSGTQPVTCSGGSVTRTLLGSPWGNNFGLNSGGDNVYILQGTRAAPQFIYALKHVGAFASATCTDKDRANLPANLTLGTSAIVMASAQNQWHYNCVVNNGSKATILASIGNNANWNSTTKVWNNTNGFFRVTGAALPYGLLQVSGAGCGFTNNCLLAYAGAANSASVAGNCTVGEQAMSATIAVPSGCTFQVIAEMKPRNYGCTNSGADGGGCCCATCDNLKVDILGGTKPFQFGSSNASISDNYTLAGPGSIVVSGQADRADEIITYSIQATTCACLTVLPIELLEFEAKMVGKSVELRWATQTERNNKFFTIERSPDASNWEAINYTAGQGNSVRVNNYKTYDYSPLKGISYYRLRQTDFDKTSRVFDIVVVENTSENQVRNIIKRIDLIGREADENTKGIIFVIYDTGEVEKLYKE